MQAISNFLSSFSDSILRLWDFLFSLIKDLFSLLRILSKLPDLIFGVFSWLDSSLFLYLSLLFSIIIVYKILGREG